MSSGVPLTKEKIVDYANPCMKCGSVQCAICYDDFKKVIRAAVAWRNNLVQFCLDGEFDHCNICHELVQVFYYDEKERKDGKVFPIMCSVCATNRAFGIENTQSGGKE